MRVESIVTRLGYSWRMGFKRLAPRWMQQLIRAAVRGGVNGRRMAKRFLRWRGPAGQRTELAMGEGEAGRQYVLSENLLGLLNRHQLDALRLCLAHQPLDFVLVSFGLCGPPSVKHAVTLAASRHVVFARQHADVFLRGSVSGVTASWQAGEAAPGARGRTRNEVDRVAMAAPAHEGFVG